MKKILLVILILPLFSIAQDERTAIVSKYKNVPVFIMSEPVKEYNIVGAVTDKFRTDTIDIKKNEPVTIDDMITRLVDYSTLLAKTDKIDFDAIVTTDGKSGTLIKFKSGAITIDSLKANQ